ncbi:MAG: acetylglutamate kinase [Clostridiales bacterium]|nr:acetylglutamate kinase [Clostridiales bacterium]
MMREIFKHFRRKTIVVKYGGAAMQSSALKNCVVKDIVNLREFGANIVLVHGGGPELSSLQARLGLETRFIEGLRYTDADTMEAAMMALCGKVNKDLVRMFENEGTKAIGLSGIDGGMLRCKRQESPDLGFVGEVVRVKKDLLHLLLVGEIIPVISTVGLGEDGLAYNINADTAAGRIAASLNADYYITLSDVPGVMYDMNDPESLIFQLETDETEGLIASGVISGGMIPKVRGLTDAIGRGVKSASIANGRVPHALILLLAARAEIENGRMPSHEEGFVGTTIVGGRKAESDFFA